MFNIYSKARHWIVLTLAVAVAAVACGEDQTGLPIEPAGPRPATATTTTTTEVVVEVPASAPPTTEAALVAVESPVETTVPVEPAPPVSVDVDDGEGDEVVVMNTWLEDAPATTSPTATTWLDVTNDNGDGAATTTTVPVSTTAAPAAPATTTTTEPPVATTTTTAPATTTTAAPAPTTTTTAAVVTAGGKVVPPIPRPGDPNVPEVNDGGDSFRVDLSWFPEMRNVIDWDDWHRIDEANTPWWAQLDLEGSCGSRLWWSYPLTIQVGTVLANAPRGADCAGSVPESYVVTRIYREPICETDDQRNCTNPRSGYAVEGVDIWVVVLCGYTFEGDADYFGISVRADAVKTDDGRFRVTTNNLYSPRACDR